MTSARYRPAEISSSARLIRFLPSVRNSETLMNGYFFSNSLAMVRNQVWELVKCKSAFLLGAFDEDLFAVGALIERQLRNRHRRAGSKNLKDDQ